MDRKIDYEEVSDDEIFFGKLTLKEVKKHVMMDRYRDSLPCTKTKTEDYESCSLKIIETCSEPELLSGITFEDSLHSSCEDKTINSFDTTDNNSFLEMEKMVSNILMEDNKEKEELDNTLDVVEYILNNAPHIEECHTSKEIKENSEPNNCDQINIQETKIDSKCINPIPIILSELESVQYCSNIEKATPVKDKHLLSNCEMSPKVTESTKKAVKNIQLKSLHSTPSLKTQVNVFKTPKSTISLKKQLQTPTTSKMNAYQHITSPVATYIKNGPQVPLLKDVRPKKSLSNLSQIPKLCNRSEIKTNKENINLPSLAYKSAKSVKVVKVPDEKKLPENQWAKTLSSSLNKAIVIKHNFREINGADKKSEPTPEDSFANLTLKQADISVCTQKTAYNK